MPNPWFLDAYVRFAPKATKLLRRRELRDVSGFEKGDLVCDAVMPGSLGWCLKPILSSAAPVSSGNFSWVPGTTAEPPRLIGTGALRNTGDGIVVDQEVFDNQLKADRFPFPSEGNITLRVRNANYALGPVMLHIVMNPGAVIPAHLHKGMAEALYVVEGDFANEGKQYQAGTSLHFKAGNAHGPQSTKNGCKLLVLWTERTSKEAADLSDFTLASEKAA